MQGEDLDMVLEAAKSSREKARDKFWKLYEDERLQEIKQGKRPEQVALDRAAFLMDAALLGANVRGWGGGAGCWGCRGCRGWVGEGLGFLFSIHRRHDLFPPSSSPIIE
jgi:hypothetical protein